MHNRKEQSKNKKETVDAIETVLFTNIGTKFLGAEPLKNLIPFLGLMCETYNSEIRSNLNQHPCAPKRYELRIVVTYLGVVASKKDFDKLRDMLENAIKYN